MESLAREVESVPKFLDPSSSSSTDASKSMCVICLSEIKKEEGKAIFTGECSHSFHFGCITKNVLEGSRICPICRFQWTQVPTSDVSMLERINWLVKAMDSLDKKHHELKKLKKYLENELEKRVQEIHELKKEIHELEEKKKQDQDVEAGEEDIGHKDSDHGIEAKSEMKGAREHEGGSKKMKKTMVRSSIMTRQKTRKLN